MSITNSEILDRLNAARTPRGKKEVKPIAKESVKMKEKKKQERKAGGNPTKLEQDKWFHDIAERHLYLGRCLCMECDAVITESFIRHATAHLLPKKIFKSVATHELNYLILGAGCGCHEKTHTVSKFITMKIFPEAARRIKEMMPLLPVDELRQISNQLIIAIDSVTEK